MGNWFSSTNDQKIDVQGQAVTVKTESSELLTTLIIVICVLKLIEFIIFIYRQHTRRLLNRFQNNMGQNAANAV